MTGLGVDPPHLLRIDEQLSRLGIDADVAYFASGSVAFCSGSAMA
jgi:hypothetical protein